MIQFNLLPDVKIEYIKARKLKRLLFFAALLALGISVLLIILTFSMAALQKQHLSNLDKDIAKLEEEFNSIEDLTKILTVQNQLNTLPGLYDGRPAAERLAGYIDQVTPAEEGTGISRLELDFNASTFVIEGVANNLETVNKFVDALKFTEYTVTMPDSDEVTTGSAFKDVVLSDFSRDESAAGFTISMEFDPLIFDSKANAKLEVPSQVTTRSELKTDIDLFNTEQPAEGGRQ